MRGEFPESYSHRCRSEMLGTFPHYLYQSFCTKRYVPYWQLEAAKGLQPGHSRSQFFFVHLAGLQLIWPLTGLQPARPRKGPRKTGNLKAAAMPVSANSRNRRSLSQACKNFILIFLAQALQKASHVWACLCNPCAVMEQAGLSASKPQHNHTAFANARISAGKVPFQSFFLLVGVVLAMCKQNRCPATAYA